MKTSVCSCVYVNYVGVCDCDCLLIVLIRTRPSTQYALGVELGSSQLGETNRSQTATDVAMVIKLSLGSWSHMWSLNNVSGCGSTSLFGSRVGTHQGK